MVPCIAAKVGGIIGGAIGTPCAQAPLGTFIGQKVGECAVPKILDCMGRPITMKNIQYSLGRMSVYELMRILSLELDPDIFISDSFISTKCINDYIQSGTATQGELIYIVSALIYNRLAQNQANQEIPQEQEMIRQSPRKSRKSRKSHKSRRLRRRR